MANKYASLYKQTKSKTLDRVSLGDADNTIEGGGVVWHLDTAVTGARTLNIRDYDKTRHGEYDAQFKPHVVIKSSIDTSGNNVTVKNSGGSTLWTFAADNSSTSAYVVLRLKEDGDWELA